jgi:hypothetical protein
MSNAEVRMSKECRNLKPEWLRRPAWLSGRLLVAYLLGCPEVSTSFNQYAEGEL